MKPPILFFEGYDLIVFDTPEEAESFVEPPDVDMGQCYDAAGQLLLFETDGRSTRIRENGELQPGALRAWDRRHPVTDRVSIDPNTGLDELVREARDRCRCSPRFKGHS